MRAPVVIHDAADPRVAAFRGSDVDGLVDPARFVVETEHVVARLLASELHTDVIVGTPARLAGLGSQIPAHVELFAIDAPLLSELVGFNRHRGVAALARRPAPIDPAAHLAGRPQATILALEGIVDPINVGAILRAARAFGVDLVLVDPRCGDPWSRRASRAAMGNAFTLAIARVDAIAPTLDALRGALACPLEIVAATVGPRARPLPEHRRGPGLALLIGSEGEGLSAALIARADHEVTIPMAAGVDSLNAAAAASVLLYALADRG
ncbi:MAG: RNA methyltransferase [Myxococcales bacterium]|nr:RNA methyltransferase [Myxococcales bacterium]